jgi:hypothetical protein
VARVIWSNCFLDRSSVETQGEELNCVPDMDARQSIQLSFNVIKAMA